MQSLRHAAVIGLAVFALSGPVWAAQHTAKSSTATAAKSSPATTVEGASRPTAGDRFSTAAAAKSHCPTGTVVWANTATKVFHFAGSPVYGHSKRGAYMCENEAMSAHFRAAKNEKHP